MTAVDVPCIINWIRLERWVEKRVELVIDQRSFGWIAVTENLPRAM